MAPGESAKPQVIVYRAREAAELTRETMSLGRMRPADERGMARAVENGLRDSALIRVLFEDEATGVSLTYAWFKSHASLPRHSHSADCLYYIVSGSLQFGNESLGAGDGFLVPSDTLYSYEAGPNGVEVLEFRTATTFDIAYSGTDASWDRLIENLKTRYPHWASLPLPEAARRMVE
jgi:quercetin dioxygenase-like cupin family protein